MGDEKETLWGIKPLAFIIASQNVYTRKLVSSK
jgi:hypothetical protein